MLSSQSSVQQTARSFKSKNDFNQTNESPAFSKFLQSISPDHQKVSESQGEKLKKLEEALTALQELPKENLSVEEFEMLSAILAVLSQQTTEMMDELPGNNLLITLSRQIEQELNDLSTISVISFEDGKSFMGGEEKKFFHFPQNNSDKAVKTLNSVFQQHENEQQTVEGPKISLQKTEPFEKLFQQLNHLIQELAPDEQKAEPVQMNIQALKIESSIQSADSTSHVSGGPVLEQVQQNQENSGLKLEQVQQNQENPGLKLEPVQTQNNSVPLTGPSAQDVQASQVTQRTEGNVQTPVVRMTSLIEDLSEILGGTFRLRTNLEGTQLRVNIFPEHLGHLDIRLTALEGKIAAQIFTSSLASKEALDLQINQLRNSLMQQGISIEKIEVTYQNSQQSFGQQHAHPEQRFSQQGQRQGVSSRNGYAYHVMEEEAAVERHHLLDGSVKVNYTI